MAAAWAQAVARKLQAPFVGGCWHWAAVLALQRLVVVALYAFVNEAADRAVCQTFVMVCFAMLHVGSRPFVQPAVQHVQTALLSVLVLIAGLNAPLAILQTGAFTGITATSANPVYSIKGRLQTAEAVLLVVPGALSAVAALVGA